jgi:hypothetical protein
MRVPRIRPCGTCAVKMPGTSHRKRKRQGDSTHVLQAPPAVDLFQEIKAVRENMSNSNTLMRHMSASLYQGAYMPEPVSAF